MDKLTSSLDKNSDLPVFPNRTGLISPNGDYELVAAEEERVHLRAYWRVIRKHLLLITVIALLGTAPFVYLSGMKPDYYKASARVQVNLENSNAAVGSEQGSAGAFLSADPAYFNTQLQILNSPTLMRRIAQTLDLEHDKIFVRHMTKGGRMIRKALRLFYLGKKDDLAFQDPNASDPLTTAFEPSVTEEQLAEAQRLEPYVEDLQKKIKVEPVKETRLSFKETRLIDISCEHPSPQLAAKIANAVADAFVISNLEQRRKLGQNADEFLNNRIGELQIRIRTGETELIEYAKNHQILTLDASQNTVVDRLAGLNRQLLEAENDRIMAEANYRKALGPGALEALTDENAKEIQSAESRLTVMRGNRAELLVGATEKWPEVKQVNQQIAELEKNIAALREKAANTIRTNLDTRYRQALDRETSLRASFNQQRSETLKQNEAAINYRIKQQEIDTNKLLLQGILQREKENDVSLRGATNNVTVVDYAITPDPREPEGPFRLLWVLMAGTVSLAGGIGFAFLIDYLDNTVRSREDVLQTMRLPTLGIIPAAKKSLRDRFGGLGLANGNGHRSPALLVDSLGPSTFSEEYKRLRTAVTLTTNGRSPKTILVTSCQKGEGKTTTSLNIATTMAQTAGAKILVIDADLHNPRLHVLLGFEFERGLSSLLTGEVPLDKVEELIVQHQPSGVYVLPAGDLPSNPAALLESGVLLQLLTHLEATFTHIIIDSPAAEEFADSVIISSVVDGVLFVVHGNKSSRVSVRHTLQELRLVGANLLGVVLNNMASREQEYSNYA